MPPTPGSLERASPAASFARSHSRWIAVSAALALAGVVGTFWRLYPSRTLNAPSAGTLPTTALALPAEAVTEADPVAPEDVTEASSAPEDVTEASSAPEDVTEASSAPEDANAQRQDTELNVTGPSHLSDPVVLHLTSLALKRAQRCHPEGRAAGTSQVFITFAPNGRVSDARLEGEPLASAPVGRCILDHARSILIPQFEGDAFTLEQRITLR